MRQTREDKGAANPAAPDCSKPGRRRRATETDIAPLLARLETASIDGLRLEWQRWLPGEAPSIQSRDVLRRLIAWRVQAAVHGGHDADTARRLKQLIADHAAKRPLAVTSRPRLSPGTVLSREWKGQTHRVTVMAKGFLYEEKRYSSLSEIARAITGTRWSGPRLFGVEAERLGGGR